ncbi:DUF2182 domain-containing protein [Burkholderia multivorans]|uniref:DUF2182 domain-containing protein n=1 Tax=Burkholderia multivorans TaxID=87883 RepID=UPI000CFE7F69|nr:DUF2182 domain-containing protein [Burkholderia multivorans]MCO1370717.1 DUF2182 domain-containing protein [Burkholderia multivorans]MCO1458025.1 DUF2182 domain-containing protein [Burkholderia multivorans]MCO1467019.1 DUF2182 domain-containing protein [Burkholderia multivorans]MDN7744252.1 DUF2182 domain-containing protein [Burkholderia multivorans]PRH12743.1 hypothetical protein C6T56_29410 [Burkholderia multivorans]
MRSAERAASPTDDEPAMNARATGRERQAFGAVLAAVSATAVAVLLNRHASMDAMGGGIAAGGWLAPAAWGHPCGWRADRALAAFAGMWGTMVVAMMLPVLAPALWHYRQLIGAHVPGPAHRTARVAIAGGAYFSVWMAIGVLVWMAGDVLAAAALRLSALAYALPFASGATVFAAGTLQLTGWKRHRLDGCRNEPAGTPAPRADAADAWRYGMRIALHCAACCGNLMTAALAAGAMDLRVMAVATAAIAAERLLPHGHRVARIVGAAMLVGGVAMLASAAGAI